MRLFGSQVENARLKQLIEQLETLAGTYQFLRQSDRRRTPKSKVRSILDSTHKSISAAITALARLLEEDSIKTHLQWAIPQPSSDEIAREIQQENARAQPIRYDPNDPESLKALSQMREERKTILKTIDQLVDDARKALVELQTVIERATLLSRTNPAGGRPKDVFAGALVDALAKMYLHYFGKPPMSTEDNDFHQMVDIVFRAIGWVQGNRHQLILAALAQPKGSKTSPPV